MEKLEYQHRSGTLAVSVTFLLMVFNVLTHLDQHRDTALCPRLPHLAILRNLFISALSLHVSRMFVLSSAVMVNLTNDRDTPLKHLLLKNLASAVRLYMRLFEQVRISVDTNKWWTGKKSNHGLSTSNDSRTCTIMSRLLTWSNL